MSRLPLLVCAALAVSLLAGCGDDREPRSGGPDAYFFGIAPQEDASAIEVARMARGGLGSYHVFLSWPAVERVRDTYDWSRYDSLLEDLAAEGVRAVPYLFGTPAAYAPTASTPPVRDPETFDAWIRFTEAALERYGRGGEFWRELAERRPEVATLTPRVWEVWNEMNGPAFWDPAPDVDEYAQLLRRTARAIGRVDPTADVMTGGVFVTPTSRRAILSYDYLEELFAKPSVRKVVDVVGIHPYGPDLDAVREQIETTIEVMEDSGLDARTHITEIGWGSDPEVPDQLNTSPEGQAELLEGAYEMFIANRDRWRLDGALWYTWRDPAAPPPNCLWCPSAGLFDRDLDPKPAWDAYAAVAGGES